MKKEEEHDDCDLLRLNALVDGELTPAERAEIAARLAADRDLARAYATLARLKASVMEFAEVPVSVRLPSGADVPARPARHIGRIAAAAALIASVTAAAWLSFALRPSPHALEERQRMVVLAAFPVQPAVPDLASAGLALRRVDHRTLADGPLLVASYLGPRGCRLELHVRPAGLAPSADRGSSRVGWSTGDLSYELVAFGMPESRFAMIVDVAQRQTKLNSDPDGAQQRLRQAGLTAPPCLG